MPSKLRYESRYQEKEFYVNNKNEAEDNSFMGFLIISQTYLSCEINVTFTRRKINKDMISQPVAVQHNTNKNNPRFDNELQKIQFNNIELLKFEGDYDLEEMAAKILEKEKMERKLFLRQNQKNSLSFVESKTARIKRNIRIEQKRIKLAQDRKKEITVIIYTYIYTYNWVF